MATAETARWRGSGDSGQVLGSRRLILRRRRTGTVDSGLVILISRELMASEFFKLFALRRRSSKEGAGATASNGGKATRDQLQAGARVGRTGDSLSGGRRCRKGSSTHLVRGPLSQRRGSCRSSRLVGRWRAGT